MTWQATIVNTPSTASAVPATATRRLRRTRRRRSPADSTTRSWGFGRGGAGRRDGAGAVAAAVAARAGAGAVRVVAARVGFRVEARSVARDDGRAGGVARLPRRPGRAAPSGGRRLRVRGALVVAAGVTTSYR